MKSRVNLLVYIVKVLCKDENLCQPFGLYCKGFVGKTMKDVFDVINLLANKYKTLFYKPIG